MFKLMRLLLMTALSLGGLSFSTQEVSSPLTKDISYKASHSDGLKHESVDSFLENEEVIFYKEISDFYGNSFDLYELSPMGYAIYAKNESSTAFLEGSHSSYSPFHDYLDTDLYYLGLGNYYYQNGTNIIDIETGTPLDNIEEITNYSYSLSEDIFLDSDESEIESYKFVNIDDDTDLGSGSGSSSGSSGSGSSSGSTSSLTTTYKGFTCIKNYEYFKDLKYFPTAEYDSCAFVALCILLGYLDLYTDGDYIIHDDYRDHEGTSQELWNDLINNHCYTLLGISGKHHPAAFRQIEKIMKGYINHDCDDGLWDLTIHEKEAITNTHSAPITYISQGDPVILTLIVYQIDYTEKTWNGMHTVVAYGYNEDDNTFLVHAGWGSGSTDSAESIVSKALIYSYNYFTYGG